MKKLTAVTLLVMLVLVGAVVVNVAQLKSASGACAISWRPTDTTCTVANPQDHFSYSLTTIVGSGSHGSWTMYQAISWPTGSNVENVDADPDTADISSTDYQEIDTLCTGDLIDGESEGVSKLNAWDGTYWGCSGSRNVTIKPNGGSCN